MRLPRAAEAVIEWKKLTGYLLSLSHRVGKAKAALFRWLGFDETNVEQFERALRAIAMNDDIREEIATPYGPKFVIVGHLENPLGREIIIYTVWIIETEDSPPRFVTAYPYDE